MDNRSGLVELPPNDEVTLNTQKNDALQGQQSRIASLYLPWILVVLDNWNRLNVAPAEAWPGASVLAHGGPRPMDGPRSTGAWREAGRSAGRRG